MLKAKESLDKRNAKVEYPSYEAASVEEESSTDFDTNEEDEEESAEAVAS